MFLVFIPPRFGHPERSSPFSVSTFSSSASVLDSVVLSEGDLRTLGTLRCCSPAYSVSLQAAATQAISSGSVEERPQLSRSVNQTQVNRATLR